MSLSLAMLLVSHTLSWSPARAAAAVRRAGVLDGRALQSARYVCDIHVRGVAYPVIATVERVLAIEPRYYRQVVVLTRRGARAQAFPVIPPAEPARCDRDQLIFDGDTVRVGDEDGRVVRFGTGARSAEIVGPSN